MFYRRSSFWGHVRYLLAGDKWSLISNTRDHRCTGCGSRWHHDRKMAVLASTILRLHFWTMGGSEDESLSFIYVQERWHLNAIFPVCPGLRLQFKLVWYVFARVSPVTSPGIRVYRSDRTLQQCISVGVVFVLCGLVSRLHVNDYFATLEAHTHTHTEQWQDTGVNNEPGSHCVLCGWQKPRGLGQLRSAGKHTKPFTARFAQTETETADKRSAAGHVLKRSLWAERPLSGLLCSASGRFGWTGRNPMQEEAGSPTRRPAEPAIDRQRHVPWIHVCSFCVWGWSSLKVNLGTSTNIFFW